MMPGRLTSVLSWALLALAASLPDTALAATPVVSSAASLPAAKTAGTISWRTFAASDSASVLFNVSTFTPKVGFTTKTGMGMYGWNFYWRGSTPVNTSRPLMIFLGSSNTRTSMVSDTTTVLNIGTSESFPQKLRTTGAYTKALLDDAGFGVLSIVSPRCYNTTSLKVAGVNCNSQINTHILRHYRPEIIQDILKQVQSKFGFDPNVVVGTGVSMGARGMLRFGTVYNMRAISVTAGGLEDRTMRSMVSGWNNGDPSEGCYTLNIPTVSNKTCLTPVPETMPLANKLSGYPVQIYASPGDKQANYTTQVRPTCDNINVALGNCQIRLQSTVSSTSRVMPSHNQICLWGSAPADLNFLIAGYGGAGVTFGGNSTTTTTTTTTTTVIIPTTTTTTDIPITTDSPPPVPTSTDAPIPVTSDAPAPAPAPTSDAPPPATSDPVVPTSNPTSDSSPPAPAPTSDSPPPPPAPTSDSPAPNSNPPTSGDGGGSGTGNGSNNGGSI
ncbi:hypothetical protein CF326_g2169 [Tilletia indica]|uniref:Triacylglycerol lipase n=1 Tax=Tilletia indica TaxID=43049 RepID=A0A177TWP3_9BASI|nr:hypothetical protein CF326_g2169 [Tilletia indica]KAE8257246.1 hypothetical protein A4X13_0g2480 [Tilletia indica]